MALTVAVNELVFNLSVKTQNINGLKPHKLGCCVFNKACILVVVICLWLKRSRYIATDIRSQIASIAVSTDIDLLVLSGMIAGTINRLLWLVI